MSATVSGPTEPRIVGAQLNGAAQPVVDDAPLAGAPHPTVSAGADTALHNKRWLILAALGVAQLMIILDSTIMNVALPAAQSALGFSNADRQWVVTAYALAFGSLLPLGGRLSDLIGRRTTFLVGLVGFAGASALGGAATNFAMLVSARTLQGVFAALLAPAAMSLLAVTFTDARERAAAFAVFGALSGTGGAIGLLLGGALTTYVSWRWSMYVNVIFAGVAFAGAAALLPRLTRSRSVPLDLWGTLTVSAGLFALVYGFSRAETDGWSDRLTTASLIASLVLVATFAWWQTRARHPLVPPTVLLNRLRAGAYLSILFTGAGIFAVFLFLTYYLQAVQGYSAIRTGVAFLPMVGAIIVIAQIAAAYLLPRLGPRVLVPLGLALCALGMSDFTVIGVDGEYATQVLPGLIVLGMGLGLVFAPAMEAAVGGVGPQDSGVASALIHTSQQVGGSVGLAVLATLAAEKVSAHLAGQAPTPELMAEAMVESYVTAFWWATGIFAVGAVLVGLLLRSEAPTPDLTEEHRPSH